MEIKNRKKHFYFDLGLFFLIYMAILITISMLLFFIGITIGPAHTLISLLLTILSFKMLKKENILQITIISIVIACLFIMISGNVIDTSYDGNAYRKPMVGLLKEGWNPVYETPEEFNAKLGSLPRVIGKDEWKWIEFFPKGMAILGASIYAISQNIECGKAYHFITMFMIFCFFYDYVRTRYFNRISSFLIALITMLNPVALTQLRTFYVDAPLNNMVIVNLIFIIMLLDAKYIEIKKEEVLNAVGLSIIIGINTKFNALYSMGVICLIFFGIVFWKERKKEAICVLSSFKIFMTLAIYTLLSIILVGFAPYVTNYLRWKEILPGVIGNTLGYMSGSFATSTDGFNTPQIFWALLFGKMGDFWSETQLPLKIPFTFSIREIVSYYIHAPHFGAYGVLFSGLFIISVIILAVIIYQNKKYIINDFFYKTSIGILGLIFIQCSLTPLGAGGLRYVGYFYVIIPLSVLLILGNIKKNSRNILMKIIAGIFIVGIFLNIIPWAKVFTDIYKESIKTNKDFSIISQNAFENDKILEVGFVRTPEEGCSGYLYNLKDYGIKCGKIVKTSDQSDKPIYYTCGWQISFYLEDFLRE